MRGRVAGTWHPNKVHSWEPYGEAASRSLCGGIVAADDSVNVVSRESEVTCSGCVLAIEAEEHPLGKKIT